MDTIVPRKGGIALEGRVYFSVADRQAEALLELDKDKEAFDRSLVLNVLFQQGLIIPDIFFYISGGLARHLMKAKQRGDDRQSLFEAAIQKNIIVPSFRKVGDSTFQEALATIREERIQGVRPDADLTASYLQRAADLSEDFSPYVPKEHLGQTFDKVLENHLLKPRLDDFDLSPDPDFVRTWLQTERWRLDGIEKARQRAKADGILGVRRGDIMNAVAVDLGMPTNIRLDDIGLLFRKFPDKKQDLCTFFQWVNDLYQYNQARRLEALPNFPRYTKLGGVIINRLLSSLPTLNTELTRFPVIREVVQFPRLKFLQKLSVNDLLAARTGFSSGYLKAVNNWRADPHSSAKAQEVRTVLREYADALLKRCAGQP